METETRALFGRRQIFTDKEEITAENVVSVLEKALRVHSQNQDEIQYLWNYYKGDTPIRQKCFCISRARVKPHAPSGRQRFLLANLP